MKSLVIGLLVIMLSGCASPFLSEGKVKVTTTTGMITDVVEQIGGDRVEVIGLMGPGVDPHLYKASQGDIRKLDYSDIIFYNGVHLEGKMTNVFEKLAQHRIVMPVTQAIPHEQLIESQDFEGQFDPHVWFDVQLWTEAAKQITKTLSEFDQKNASFYLERSEKYLHKLALLNQYIHEQVQKIPKEHRVLVTAHDAFSYFGKAYGFQVMGLQGLSTASEYGSKDVSKLRDFLIEKKIKAVFIESSVPSRSIEAVLAGAKSMGHIVNLGGELYSDAMGSKGTEQGTYLGMVKYNVDTIVSALQ